MTEQVHVRFFAIFREYVGLKEDWAQIEPGTTVEELWRSYAVKAKNPRVIGIRAAYSVNQRLAKPETPLSGGEEVGFLPPVSGGAGARKKAKPRSSPRRAAEPVRILITSRKLNLARLIHDVEYPGAGAIVTFVGTVRNNSKGKQVKYLEYEAYDELAVRMLEQICQEAQARWTEARLVMAHRTGRLDIGDASVMIAVSAPHRADAFAACRYAFERIKSVLPVWKREFAADGDYWVEGPVAGESGPDEAERIAREADRF